MPTQLFPFQQTHLLLLSYSSACTRSLRILRRHLAYYHRPLYGFVSRTTNLTIYLARNPLAALRAW